MTSKAEFLGQLHIFSELVEEELEDLASITEEYEFEDGSVIAYQRDVADKFYIVHSGRLYAFQVDERGIVRDTRAYMPGDYFEDVWLFTPMTHPATVRGSGSGRVLIIEQGKFLDFLNRNPGLVEVLNLSDPARQAAARSRVALPRRYRDLGLLPEEIVEYEGRRSQWLLAFRLSWPLFFIFILLVVAATQWRAGASPLLLIVLAIPIFLFGFIALFQFLDWYNDYFVITSKHLIHHEFDLRRFRARTSKTSIDQIQSVEVEKPNLLATILNTGTARITTAAQAGVLLFDYIDDPAIVRSTINRLREQVRAMDAGRAQAAMRASVEQHFQAQPAYARVAEAEAAPVPAEAQQPSFLERVRRAISPRVEAAGIITYRKHPFVLLANTWWIILVWLALFTGMVLINKLGVVLILLLLLAFDSAYFVWQFEDWRNDTFQLGDRYVVDIDRRPFGFGESRKQAELGNIQNINSDKPGILPTIFNYGNVYIETAGASADITFESVVNPNLIQSDIFRRRELFRQRQRVQEGEQRRKEYAVLLDVYQQAQEQNRLPRRTPP